MASVDDQEKQSSKSWLRHALESALIALDRPAGFLVPVGAAVVCIRAVSSFLDALLVYQAEHALLGQWAGQSLDHLAVHTVGKDWGHVTRSICFYLVCFMSHQLVLRMMLDMNSVQTKTQLDSTNVHPKYPGTHCALYQKI